MKSLLQKEEEIKTWLEKSLSKRYKGGVMRRYFHPKMHGLAKATLTISPDIPTAWQVGIFQAGKQYKCWARFSSTNPHVKPDWKKNFRGLAVKVLHEGGTQDFLTVNIPTFQAKDALMLDRYIRAITGNIWNKIVFFFAYISRSLRALEIKSPCYNLLEAQYWSQSAFALGDAEVKFSFIPRKQATSTKPQKPTDNFLKERLEADLAQQEAWFDLAIQFRTNPDTMSIEDSTRTWDSPWHKIGTLHLFKQDIDKQERWTFGENVTYSPWHCLQEHRPLGKLNEMRKRIYEHLQAYRHKENQVMYHKPTLQDWENMP